ncbi:MAG: hypothetical protein ABIT83_17495 [Massilia sp.]
MELVKVIITGQVITARYGTLNTGDVLQTDVAFAAHLVKDCGAAKYADEKSDGSTGKASTAAPIAPKGKKKTQPPPSESTPNPAAIASDDGATSKSLDGDPPANPHGAASDDGAASQSSGTGEVQQ